MKIRLILGILIFIACFFIALIKNTKQKARHLIFNDLYNFNEQLISELGGQRRSVNEILSNNSYCYEFIQLYNEYAENNRLEESKFNLSGEEINFISEYFYILTKIDLSSKKELIVNMRDRLKYYRDIAFDDMKKKSFFTYKISLLIGGFIFIVII